MAARAAKAENYVKTKGGLVIPRPQTVNARWLTTIQEEMVEIALLAYRRDAHNSVEEVKVGAAIMTSDARMYMGANLRTAGAKRHLHAEDAALIAAERDGPVKGVLDLASVSNQGPQFPSESCSTHLFNIAAKSGIDTHIVLANDKLTEFIVTKISTMFSMRNIPLGTEMEQ